MSTSSDQRPGPPPPGVRWQLVVLVDPAPATAGGRQAPPEQAPRTVTLAAAESLIGREGTDLQVAVPLADGGVSRRHALLTCRPDGGLSLRDLGSCNGTLLNGAFLPNNADTLLHDGDTIRLGVRTRLTVRAVPP
jgi:pSer/pThr/pTyr-binding forkhead associated (FHA) protein